MVSLSNTEITESYLAWEDSKNSITHRHIFIPPNEAATATEPTTVPAALAAAANPPAPITGIKVPKVGAKAPSPAAIAGAANPVLCLKVKTVKSTRKLTQFKSKHRKHVMEVHLYHQ
jgi:hypothetical protein